LTTPLTPRTDLREWALSQIQDTLKAIVPGATLTTWDGMHTEPFVSDIGGRVYSRRRPQQKISEEECPYVEFVASPQKRDTLEPLDDDAYMAAMQVVVTGYDRADDAGDSFDAPVRAKLHELGSDLRMAIEASQAQSWRGRRFGSGLVINQENAEYIVAADGPYGAVIIEATVRYPFCARWP
jgi:hypothetical protein